jgi:ribosomal protein S18 acetylase RimI-like enzyme
VETKPEDRHLKFESFLQIKSSGWTIGKIRMNTDNNSIYVSDVWTHPRYRRQGIATQLFTECFHRYPERRFSLHVYKDNFEAQSFYTQLGFVRTTRRFRDKFEMVREVQPAQNKRKFIMKVLQKPKKIVLPRMNYARVA